MGDSGGRRGKGDLAGPPRLGCRHHMATTSRALKSSSKVSSTVTIRSFCRAPDSRALSRVVFSTWELEDLIDLVESHPIRIDTVKGGGFDLNAHEGRLMARQLVAIASYESGRKADRIRRANRQKAERGEWHGAPKFGYGLGGVLIPGEAAIVREMADRFLAGQSLRSITSWLNDEFRYPSPKADTSKLKVWHATTVKSILVSARISGQRAYELTRKAGDAPTGREILGAGNWEPIITPEEMTRIRGTFASPDRRVGRSSINLLSAIATCGVCGAGLVSGRHRAQTAPAKRRYYRCMPTTGYPERGKRPTGTAPLPPPCTPHPMDDSPDSGLNHAVTAVSACDGVAVRLRFVAGLDEHRHRSEAWGALSPEQTRDSFADVTESRRDRNDTEFWTVSVVAYICGVRAVRWIGANDG
ncbi:recombinase family protein [Luethyella okanaganae]|uniref:Recombinase family protein n=1 Tax=Luethyella okanaganae TaxID=69372 RepID=A0ABW1VAK9_9MICO